MIEREVKSSVGIPRIDPDTRSYTDAQGQTWVTRNFFKINFGLGYHLFPQLLAGIPTIQGISPNNKPTMLLNQTQAEAELIKKGYKKKFVVRKDSTPRAKKKTGYVDELGEVWRTTNVLAQEFRISHPTMKKILTSSIPIKGRASNGNVVNLYNQREASSLINRVGNRLTRGKLAEELGVQPKKIRELAEAYLKEHPDWIVKGRGMTPDEYSPDLAQKIREELSRTSVPEGWKTPTAVATKLRLGGDTAKNIAGKYTKEHPEWQIAVRHGNRSIVYLAPELIKKIEREIRESATIPGWITNHSLARELKRGEVTVWEFTRPYRKTHPEWFRKAKYESRKGGRIVTLYSPELSNKVREELSATKEAPDGWVTINSLAKFLSAAKDTVSLIAEQYRDDHPEWFSHFRTASGGKRPSQHYSPELVREIATKIKSRHNLETAPPGWETMASLIRKLKKAGTKGTSYNFLRGRVESLTEVHPEWMQFYVSGRNKRSMYFVSPELVSTVIAEVKGSIAPKGWLTNYGLRKMLQKDENLHVDARTINRLAAQVQHEHPEWFREFFAQGGRTSYYSPEAINEIATLFKDHFEKRKVKPPHYWNDTTIESEALEFLKNFGELRWTLLDRNNKGLLKAIEKYPGGLEGLRRKLGLSTEIPVDEARKELQKLVEV